MTNDEMARRYLTTATYILTQARASLNDGIWNVAVRRAQESVELGLKPPE